MNEVLEKDKGVESAEKEIVRTYETLDALKAAVKSDPAIRDDYLSNGDKYSIAEKTEEPKAETPSPAEPTLSKRKVTLEVDDEMLGTYGKNREADAAILEALKGNKEKDKTIDFFKNEKLPTVERELQEARTVAAGLKKQIAEYEAKKMELSVKKVEKTNFSDFPEFKDDESILDDETGPKILKALKNLKEYQTHISGLESKIEALEGSITTAAKARERDAASEAANRQLQEEFQEIDRVVETHAEALGKARSFKSMQDDYVGFMDNLKSISGIDGPLFDEAGAFRKEVQDRYRIYHEESDSGKALREICKAKGIGLPQDFDVLSRIYAIRGIRNNHFERGSDGNPVPISYDKAIRLYQSENPEKKLAVSDSTRQMSEIEKRARAAENLNKTSELPAEGGAVVDIENYPREKFMAQMKKPVDEWTDFEVNLFKQVAKTRGQSAEWTARYLGSRYKE